MFPWIGRLCAIMIALTPVAAALGDPVMLGATARAQLAALPTIHGEAIEPGDLEDEVVIVTFFASWCPPCRTEFHHLNTVAAEFADANLAIVAVNVFEEFDENDAVRLARFLQDTQPRFHVVEGDQPLMKTFGDIQRIPTVFVFDASGRPVMHFIHTRGAKKMSVSEDELRSAISQALASGSSR